VLGGDEGVCLSGDDADSDPGLVGHLVVPDPGQGQGDDSLAVLDADGVQVYQTDARTLPLKSGSVHTVITSPPYWSLRDYGLKPVVWDWDESKAPIGHLCMGGHHDWVSAGELVKRGAPIATSMAYEKGAARIKKASAGEFCTQCSAWRGTLGLEPTVDLYIKHICDIFDEVKRVLRDDGTCWLNIGDCYDSGTKQRWLVPHRLALALQERGWIVRSDIIWAKGISFVPSYAGSVMPESVRDRPTCSHEHIFLLTKSKEYWYDYEAAKEPGRVPSGTRAARGSGTREGNRRPAEYAIYDGKRNPRDVWAIGTKGYRGAHFATFPERLVEPMLRTGCPPLVCPHCGTGWQHTVDREQIPDTIRLQMEAARMQTAARTGRTDGHTQCKSHFERAVLGEHWSPGCTCVVEGDEAGSMAEILDAGIAVPGIVLDPFGGSGTVAATAQRFHRRAVLIEPNPTYVALIHKRLLPGVLLPADVQDHPAQ
jgi:DNA modification methylase